jgi:hypothetical protein
MMITMMSTDKITTIDGVPVRCWIGKTEEGTVCHVFVHRLAVREEADRAEFDRELKEQLPPAMPFPISAIL